ncbi:MAG: hypothetical protein ACP5D6_03615 [Kosmotogaceae bacterium]
MNKRSILLILFLSFIIFVFPVDKEIVLEEFNEYVSDYKRDESTLEEVIQLKSDLENLALYRFYKVQMVGSVEKRESSTTMAELLSAHMYSLPEGFFADYNQKIAYSAFLAWVLSEISYADFQLGTINEMPAYANSFSDYVNLAQNRVVEVYKAWILYSLGLVKEKPDKYPDDLAKTDSFSQWNIDINQIDDESVDDVRRFTGNMLIQELNRVIENLSSNPYNASTIFIEMVRERAKIVANNVPENIREEAQKLFEYWIYRSFSLVEKAPGYPEQLPVNELDIQNFENPLQDSEVSLDKVISFLNNNPDVMTQVITNLRVQKMMIQREDFTPTKLIESDVESEINKLKSSIAIQMGDTKNELSKMLIDTTTADVNLDWLRFIGYIVLALLSLTYLKMLKRYFVPIIITAEVVYVVFFANLITNIVNISVYSSLVLPLLLFTGIIYVSKLLTRRKKKTVLDFLALALIILIMIVPFIKLYNEVPEIALNNHPEFHESVYYGSLKYDLFDSDNALLNREIDDLTSLISSEFTELRRAYGVLLGNTFNSLARESNSDIMVTNNRVRVMIPSYSEYFSIENHDEYINQFEELQRRLKEFSQTSMANYKNYLSMIDQVINRSETIVKYSSGYLKDDFRNYLNEKLGNNPQFEESLTHVERSLKNEFDTKPEPGTIRIYSSVGFQGLLIGLMLFGPFTVLFKKPLFIITISVILVIGLVSCLINANVLNIFVHSNAPILETQTSSNMSILFFILYSCIIVVSIIYAFTLYKKGRELT